MHRQLFYVNLLLIVLCSASFAQRNANGVDLAPEPTVINLPYVAAPPTIVMGKVTFNGQPMSNTEVRELDTDVRTMTNTAGVYQLLINTRDNRSYTIYWSNRSHDPTLLATWTSRGIEAKDGVATVPTFDIGPAAQSAPAPEARVDMPVTFKWHRRLAPGPNEQYQIWLDDDVWGDSFGAWQPYPAEQETMDCVLHEGTIDLEKGYWVVRIQTDDGMGYSHARRIVIGKTIVCP